MKAADVKNQYLLSAVVAQFIELRPKGRDKWGCCPFHGEKTSSFCVQDDRRSWHCFGCGKHGDVIDFVQLYQKCSIPEAIEIITGEKAGDAPRPRAELPPIVDCYDALVAIPAAEADLPRPGQWFKAWNPKPSDKAPEGRFVNYQPRLVHPYRDTAGALLGCTIRVEMPDRKIVPMLRMIEKDGARVWSHFPFLKPRPVYGAERLVLPGVVLIVEGEKCADIAYEVIGGACITWAGGTNAAKFTEWSSLKDRNVLLWPDADQPGAEAMAGTKELCLAAGAMKVRSLGWDKEKPKGWDVADAVMRDKMGRQDIIDWMRKRLEIEGAV